MLSTALPLLADTTTFSPGESVLVGSPSGGVGSAVAQLVPIPGGGPRVGTVGRAEKAPSGWDSGYDFALTRGDNRDAAVRAAAGGEVDSVLDPLGAGVRGNPPPACSNVDWSADQGRKPSSCVVRS